MISGTITFIMDWIVDVKPTRFYANLKCGASQSYIEFNSTGITLRDWCKLMEGKNEVVINTQYVTIWHSLNNNTINIRHKGNNSTSFMEIPFDIAINGMSTLKSLMFLCDWDND